MKRVFLVCFLFVYMGGLSLQADKNLDTSIDIARAKKIDETVSRVNSVHSYINQYILDTAKTDVSKIGLIGHFGMKSELFLNFSQKSDFTFSIQGSRVIYTNIVSNLTQKQVKFYTHSKSLHPQAVVKANLSMEITLDAKVQRLISLLSTIPADGEVSTTEPSNKAKKWYKPDGEGGFSIYQWDGSSWKKVDRAGSSSNSGTKQKKMVLVAKSELPSTAKQGDIAYIKSGDKVDKYIYSGTEWLQESSSSNSIANTCDASNLGIINYSKEQDCMQRCKATGNDSYAFECIVTVVKKSYKDTPLGNLKTGKTVSFYAKDDGDLKAGADRNFTRDDANDIVLDNVTKLKWQDNRFVKTNNTNWSDAKTYCEELTLGEYDKWRLPTIKELMSISDKGKTNPSLFPVFQNYTNSNYWAINDDAQADAQAWYLGFSQGVASTVAKTSSSQYIRCVLSPDAKKLDTVIYVLEEITHATVGTIKTGKTSSYYTKDDGNLKVGTARSYTRNSSDDIITDNATKLMWQDSRYSQTTHTDFETAKAYCQSLTLGGYGEWRLPTIQELMTLSDKGQYNPSIDPTFKNRINSLYWSSTLDASDNTKAWFLGFVEGMASTLSKTDTAPYTRCVSALGVTKDNSALYTLDNITYYSLGMLKTGKTSTFYGHDDGADQKGTARDFTRSDDVVVDQKAKLAWQDDSEAKTVTKTFSDAQSYCQNLSLGGYNNWRVPTVKELMSISDKQRTNPSLFTVFQNSENSNYWSSTVSAGNSANGWYVEFGSGNSATTAKSSAQHIRCVHE